MKSVARSYIWWPGLDKAIEEVVKSCISCQAVKHFPPVAPVQPWTWPNQPWKNIHLDFAGPFQGSVFLIAVDAHSKCPEVFVMKETTAAVFPVKLLNISHLLLQYSHGHGQISLGREYIWTLLVHFKDQCFSLLLMLILSVQKCLL